MPAEMGLAKTHILENCDLPTLLEPAPAHAVQVIRELPWRGASHGLRCRGSSSPSIALTAKMTLQRRSDVFGLAPLQDAYDGAMPGMALFSS